jgi:hypothetical protein
MTNKFDRIQKNTNKKYIIQNCPCYFNKPEADCWADQLSWCKNITDCVLKQIVELARGNTGTCANCEAEPPCDNICDTYRLNKILQLLDIQEVE